MVHTSQEGRSPAIFYDASQEGEAPFATLMPLRFAGAVSHMRKMYPSIGSSCSMSQGFGTHGLSFAENLGGGRTSKTGCTSLCYTIGLEFTGGASSHALLDFSFAIAPFHAHFGPESDDGGAGDSADEDDDSDGDD